MTRSKLVAILLAFSIAPLVMGATAKPKTSAYAPHIDPADFQAAVDHPYFPLVPGTTCLYREVADGRTTDNEVTVLAERKVIMGVSCVVVHDVVRTKDAVLEDTYDWYAQDRKGNVWYFGEDTKEFMSHGKVNTEGSWEAGVGRNLPGIIMPANPAPGAPYRQEYGPGHAEDMGQVVAVHDSVTVPCGSYTGCVMTKEWSLLEPGTERKWYAKGVGAVRTYASSKDHSELVSITRP